MRILYHHRTLGDGAEGVHIEEMVAAFRDLGHQVEVRGIAANGNNSGGRRLAGRLKSALPRAAFEVASAAANAADYFEVRRAIRRMRPDFLYKRHARLDLGAVWAARRAQIPTVLEVNCLFTGASYNQFEPIVFHGMAERFERRVLGLADVVLAVSTPLARQIENLASIRAVVMPNGADPHRFDPQRNDGRAVRARLGIGDALTVGWAGVIREWHGLELLIDALATIPEARLLIVGDGPGRAGVEHHARSAGLSDRLVVTGRVPSIQMPEYLATFDIAVVASDGTGIASPMKLLEYMSMERAVVAPRLENIRDLLTDECDGLLFEPGHSSDLAKKLHRLAGDPQLRMKLGRKARHAVVGTRNWRRNAERVVALVNECAGSANDHHRAGRAEASQLVG